MRLYVVEFRNDNQDTPASAQRWQEDCTTNNIYQAYSSAKALHEDYQIPLNEIKIRTLNPGDEDYDLYYRNMIHNNSL